MMMKAMRFLLVCSLFSLVAGCGASMVVPKPAPEGMTQAGTFVVREDQVMRLAAGTSGTGTLIFQGWQYEFHFSDAKITMTGNEGGDIEGTVYNLETVKDFEGTYTPRPEYDEAKHLTGLWARNDRGVIVNIHRLGSDIAVDFEAKGATVKLVD